MVACGFSMAQAGTGLSRRKGECAGKSRRINEIRPELVFREPDLGTTAPGDGATEQRPAGLHGSPSRRRLFVAGLLIILSLVALYLLVPKLAGLHQTWGRLRHGDPLWLVVAAGMELLSIAGYAVLFRTVFGRGVPRLDWRASVQIPLAGIAAIRLFAAAGAGGVAVTAWALGRAGMEGHTTACRSEERRVGKEGRSGWA